MIKQSRRLRHILAAAVLAAAPAATFAQLNLATIIPESAVAAVWLNDSSKFKESLNVSPYGKLWNDPASAGMRSQVDEFIKEQDADAAAKGLPTFEEIKQIVTGGVAFYFSPETEIVDIDALSFTGILELNDAARAEIEEKTKTIPDRFVNPEKSSFETSGVTVYKVTGALDHSEETATVTYAYVDDLFVYADSDSDDSIKDAINRLKGNATTGSLAQSGASLRYEEERPIVDDQVNVFVDSGRIIRDLVKTPGNEQAAMFTGLVPGLGITDLESLFISVTPSEKSFDTDIAITTPNQLSGIFSAFKGSGPTPMDSVNLAPADALSVTSFSLDMGLLWDSILQSLSASSPEMANNVQMGVLFLQSQVGGTDVLNGLIRNLAGEHIIVQRPLDQEIANQLSPEEAALQNSTAGYLHFRDGDLAVRTLKMALDAINNSPSSQGTLEVEDQGGVTVVRLAMPNVADQPIKPSFAFNNQMLIIANNDVQLSDAIRQLSNPAGNSIRDAKGFREIAEKVDRPSTHLFSFTPSSAISYSVKQIRQVLQSDQISTMIGDIDPELLPSEEVVAKYFGNSYSTTEIKDGIIHINTVLLAK